MSPYNTFSSLKARVVSSTYALFPHPHSGPQEGRRGEGDAKGSHRRPYTCTSILSLSSWTALWVRYLHDKEAQDHTVSKLLCQDLSQEWFDSKTHTPTNAFYSLNKEALTKSMLNHISNQESAYPKLEAETNVTTARKNTVNLCFPSKYSIICECEEESKILNSLVMKWKTLTGENGIESTK